MLVFEGAQPDSMALGPKTIFCCLETSRKVRRAFGSVVGSGFFDVVDFRVHAESKGGESLRESAEKLVMDLVERDK